VVTLEDGRMGLSDNYLKVSLASSRGANRLEDVRIGGLAGEGLHEVRVLHVTS
jgi:hypothetical protein